MWTEELGRQDEDHQREGGTLSWFCDEPRHLLGDYQQDKAGDKINGIPARYFGLSHTQSGNNQAHARVKERRTEKVKTVLDNRIAADRHRRNPRIIRSGDGYRTREGTAKLRKHRGRAFSVIHGQCHTVLKDHRDDRPRQNGQSKPFCSRIRAAMFYFCISAELNVR